MSSAIPRRRQDLHLAALSTVAVLSSAALVWGWNVRAELYLTPESGFGYALGIVGTSLMVLLLLYSLRKRLQPMRSWGPIRHWFGTHMLLGVAGPVAILFHANFKLGSLNSTVALACMLLVAASGLIGRFIYPKIHHGLFGHRASLRELEQDAERNRGAIGAALAGSPRLADDLRDFEAFALAENLGVVGRTWRLLALPPRGWWLRRRGLRGLETAVTPAKFREATEAVRSYVAGVRRVAEFGTYERLFSLWHAFHLPFCVMLFLAAAVHVIAVHMY
jgi:hypothetical protein